MNYGVLGSHRKVTGASEFGRWMVAGSGAQATGLGHCRMGTDGFVQVVDGLLVAVRGGEVAL